MTARPGDWVPAIDTRPGRSGHSEMNVVLCMALLLGQASAG